MKYDFTSRLLHWVSALVILWATISGFYTLLPNIETQVKQFIAGFNVSLTAVFIPLFCYRIYHRIVSQTPDSSDQITPFEKKISHVMHTLLYVVVGVVLVTGVLMMDRPISIFNLVTFDQIFHNTSVITGFKMIHKFATELLAVCVFIHIAALVKHQLMGKKILSRMI